MLYLMIAVTLFFWAIVAWILTRKPPEPLEPLDPLEPKKPVKSKPRKRAAKPAAPPAKKDYILIDGSNVMYWEDQSPKLQTVQDAVRLLLEKGFTPGVMFDANAGYLLFDGYKDDHEFARVLNLREDQVLVVAKGVQADPYLLNAARDLNARIVTNDFFRDWAKDFPEVRRRGHLIQGGYHNGKLWLDLDGSHQNAKKPSRKKR
ncbi:NYN domain-containing protein [Litoreibacter janthinus]|uniref:Zc3h12a-like Ribonuclease NYN domain-containing protein n=1 Tax=Litoreibacter janthinus TaxID=670154 RepID=A0A1I6FT87_9RHOB|nr:hypothetical protein [Litoreibacter janthinus]SFR33141.1 Zc3h12a-like Ribonuclease NYN domain-containing protein [Litoreibacter janthinus]